MQVKSVCAALGECASNHIFPLTLYAIALPLQFASDSVRTHNYSEDPLNVVQRNIKFALFNYYGM